MNRDHLDTHFWEEVRDRAQYASWPDPVRRLRCRQCNHVVIVRKSGWGLLGAARARMRKHLRREHGVQF